MHVLILGAGWPPEVFIERKLRALVAAGVRVSLAELEKPTPPDWSGIPGVNYLPLRDAKNLSPRALATMAGRLASTSMRRPAAPLHLWKATRAHSSSIVNTYAHWRHGLAFTAARPDVIHFEWNRAAIRFEWVFDYFDCPSVISCRGRQANILPHLPGFEEYAEATKRTLKKATIVHCVSDAMRETAIGLGVEPSRAMVVRTSIDPAKCCDANTPRRQTQRSGPLRLITVGGLIWRKGFDYLLRALHEVGGRGVDATLDIIGSGAEEERIRHTACDLGLNGRVRLLGQLSPEAVHKELADSDIYVLASLSEGLSNSVVEAMACGIPVITTSCGGMEEAVSNNVEGIVVPTRDPAAIAGAVCSLAANPRARERMGEAGRNKVRSLFTPERQARDFISLYAEAERISRVPPAGMPH